MAKKILAAFLALIMMLSVLAFVGCDGQGDTDTDNGGDSQQPSGDQNGNTGDGNTDIPDSGDKEDGGTTEDEGYKPRGDEYVREGDIIYFGMYPQSEVTDETLKTTLVQKAGTLPTADNSQSWTSYGYYKDASNTKDYMWYIDVTEGEHTYRGVYFIQYRPDSTNGSVPSQSNSYQYKNGYKINTVYWFKYEPIPWSVVTESDGTALLLCNIVLDEQAYQNEYESEYVNNKWYTYVTGTKIHANSYAASSIRKWLNDTFYELAFDEYQKKMILTTTVDNSFATTGYNSNTYTCENTEDNVFLMSYKEMTNMDLGFNSDPGSYQPARQKKTTAYSRAQGTYSVSYGEYAYNGVWWLRSPNSDDVMSARSIRNDGDARGTPSINSTIYGVVPALRITLFE